MSKALQVAVVLLVPLAWGLLVDLLFELLRRRSRSAKVGPEDNEAAG